MIVEFKGINSFDEQEKILKEKTGKDFAFFYKKFYPKLIFFTNDKCKDLEKAQFLTNQSFLTAMEKIGTYEKDKAQFSTWLYTIAKNTALQHLKDVKKMNTISIDQEFDEEGTTLKDFIPEQEENQQVYYVTDKKAEIIKKYMDELKEPYKKVIEMREIHKMSYKDIALQLPIYQFTKEFAPVGEYVTSKFKVGGKHIEYGLFEDPNTSQCYFLTKTKLPKENWFEFHTNLENEIGNKVDSLNQKEIKDCNENVLCIETIRENQQWYLQAKNLSTVKSQIRNGRGILIKKSKKEFNLLDEMYL